MKFSFAKMRSIVLADRFNDMYKSISETIQSSLGNHCSVFQIIFSCIFIFLFYNSLTQIEEIRALTYYDVWWMGAENEALSAGNAHIMYTYPEIVQTGKPFQVGVTLEYIKDDSARANWVIFSNVSVNLRSLPAPDTQPNMADLLDTNEHLNSGIIYPGQQYSHGFTLIAPTQPGRYMVVLTFNALFGPGSGAVGSFEFDTGAYYNQTSRDAGIIDLNESPPLIVQKDFAVHRTLNIEFEEPYSQLNDVKVSIDNKNFSVLNNEVKIPLPDNSSHIITVPREIYMLEDNGIRALFVRWSDGEDSNQRHVTLNNNVALFARYKVQYFLEVNSTLGTRSNPEGTGWYDGGTEAKYSVDASAGFWTLESFDRWVGDISETNTSPSGFLSMDGPKIITALWKFDLGYLGAILGTSTAALTIFGTVHAKKNAFVSIIPKFMFWRRV